MNFIYRLLTAGCYQHFALRGIQVFRLELVVEIELRHRERNELVDLELYPLFEFSSAQVGTNHQALGNNIGKVHAGDRLPGSKAVLCHGVLDQCTDLLRINDLALDKQAPVQRFNRHVGHCLSLVATRQLDQLDRGLADIYTKILIVFPRSKHWPVASNNSLQRSAG